MVGNRTFGKGACADHPSAALWRFNEADNFQNTIFRGSRCVQAIDYKHRNEDGSVGRIPDSLTTVFHTAAGREVRDGGGVTPRYYRQAG